jgi:hypothetical protein
MKKWIFSLALIISTSTFASEILHFAPTALKKTCAPAENVNPDSVTTGHLSVKGMQITGFEGESRAKLMTAFQVLETVVNSEEFKDRVINFMNDKCERKFASSKGLTNEQIYQIFMEGRETLQQNTPGEMNYFLKLYNAWWSRVIGYTSGDTNLININWKFFKKFQPSDVAGNLAHEWTHKIGFDHKSAAEHDSAPYAIGYIVDELSAKVLKGSKLY